MSLPVKLNRYEARVIQKYLELSMDDAGPDYEALKKLAQAISRVSGVPLDERLGKEEHK